MSLLGICAEAVALIGSYIFEEEHVSEAIAHSVTLEPAHVTAIGTV